MNGVDVLDQLLASYDRQHRFKNWKQQAYHTAWSILCVMAYKMYCYKYKHLTHPPLRHDAFKEEVAKGLLLRESPRVPTSTPDVIDSVPEAVLHPFVKMRTRSHCRFPVINESESNKKKKSMVQCGNKAWKACIANECGSVFKEKVYYLCGKHYNLHFQ